MSAKNTTTYPSTIDPINWVKKLIAHQGPDNAYRIVSVCGVPKIGKDGSDPNPHFTFYKNAMSYLKKAYPDVGYSNVPEQV